MCRSDLTSLTLNQILNIKLFGLTVDTILIILPPVACRGALTVVLETNSIVVDVHSFPTPAGLPAL